MNIPVSGLILVPLSLTIFFFLPDSLVGWMIFVTIFHAASVLNLKGGFTIGLAPIYFVGCLIALRLVPQWSVGRLRFVQDEPVVSLVRILAIFVLWSVLSAFLLPVLFAGMRVDVPRAGVDNLYYFQLPLRWSPSNAGQAGYLMLEFLMVVYLLYMSTRLGLERIEKAFSWAGLFVVAVGVYQILCHRLGLQFPAWLFNSNETWAQNFDQHVGAGIFRISATFVEPADAALFLAPWCMFQLTLAMSNGTRSRLNWICVVLGTVILVETTSSTGYIVGVLIWIVVACNFVSSLLLHGRIKPRVLAALGVVGGAGILTLATMPDVQSLLNELLFAKNTSTSGLHRSVTFGRAVNVFYQSFGLGVGLGSNRAMSLFFYLLSNVGLPGLMLFIYLLWESYGQVSQRLSGRVGTECIFLRATAYALVVNLFTMLLSGAEITTPYLWIFLGMLFAGLRVTWRMEKEMYFSEYDSGVAPMVLWREEFASGTGRVIGHLSTSRKIVSADASFKAAT